MEIKTTNTLSLVQTATWWYDYRFKSFPEKMLLSIKKWEREGGNYKGWPPPFILWIVIVLYNIYIYISYSVLWYRALRCRYLDTPLQELMIILLPTTFKWFDFPSIAMSVLEGDTKKYRVMHTRLIKRTWEVIVPFVDIGEILLTISV